MEWVEITKEEFFSTIGQRDVHPSPQGNWPYVSYWKTPGGQVVGKSDYVDGKYPLVARYYRRA